MNKTTPWRLSALAAAALLGACGGSSDPEVVVQPEPTRPQDGRSFTAAKQDVRPEIEVLGDFGQRDRIDHALAQVGQLALGHVVAVVHHVGDRPTEHGIAEELEPLVADGAGSLGTPRPMGERTTQQGFIGEVMADAIGQRCEIRVGSGRHHATLFYLTRSWT